MPRPSPTSSRNRPAFVIWTFDEAIADALSSGLGDDPRVSVRLLPRPPVPTQTVDAAYIPLSLRNALYEAAPIPLGRTVIEVPPPDAANVPRWVIVVGPLREVSGSAD